MADRRAERSEVQSGCKYRWPPVARQVECQKSEAGTDFSETAMNSPMSIKVPLLDWPAR